MKSTVGILAISAIAGAAAFSPAGLSAPALRQKPAVTSLHMGKSDSYTRNFGYPCSDGRGLIEKESGQAAKQNKIDGWVYRPTGDKTQSFGEGTALYSVQESQNKAAKVNVRRYHASK